MKDVLASCDVNQLAVWAHRVVHANHTGGVWHRLGELRDHLKVQAEPLLLRGTVFVVIDELPQQLSLLDDILGWMPHRTGIDRLHRRDRLAPPSHSRHQHRARGADVPVVGLVFAWDGSRALISRGRGREVVVLHQRVAHVRIKLACDWADGSTVCMMIRERAQCLHSQSVLAHCLGTFEVERVDLA